ncbi:MAG: hypothetical protein ACI9UN_004493 [Granulosicoccus sp.]|jgi:hypothetical protein
MYWEPEMGDLPDGLSEDELEKLDELVSARAEEIPHGLKASTNSHNSVLSNN